MNHHEYFIKPQIFILIKWLKLSFGLLNNTLALIYSRIARDKFEKVLIMIELPIK
jgi:hypothetical protein